MNRAIFFLGAGLVCIAVGVFLLVGIQKKQLGREFFYDFATISGIAIDNKDNVYIADSEAGRVVKFDAGGIFQLEISPAGFKPVAVAVAAQGAIFAVDKEANRLYKFDSAGRLAGSVGGKGTTNGLFNAPSGVALDNQGNVYVTDTDNNQVQVFDPNGRFLRAWGAETSNSNQLTKPGAIAIDRQNNVFVSDLTDRGVQRFDTAGKSLGFVSQFTEKIFPNDITTSAGKVISSNAERKIGPSASLAIGGLDYLYIVNQPRSGYDTNTSVLTNYYGGLYKFNPGGGQFANSQTCCAYFNATIAVQEDNNYYYLADNNTVQRYNSSGISVDSWIAPEAEDNGNVVIAIILFAATPILLLVALISWLTNRPASPQVKKAGTV